MAGLDFKTPFDDDSHTLHDGPLQRFFRMRKWFFAVGLFLLVLDTGWWNYNAAMAAIGLTGPPKPLLISVLTVVGLYLTVQSALIILQILLTYRRTQTARHNLLSDGTIVKRHESIDTQIKDLEKTGFDLDRGLADLKIHHELYFPTTGKLRPLYRWYSLHVITKEAPQGGGISPPLAKYLDLLSQKDIADEIQRQDKSWIVLSIEILLDFIRIAPTFAFLVYGLFAHGSFSGFSAAPPTP